MDVITGAIATIAVTFITLYLKEIYFPKKKTIYFNKHKSLCYIELDRVCLEIQRSVRSVSTYIAYFHNGGTFINGVSMDKYTVVGECYRDYLSSYKKKYVNCMINTYAYAFHRLIVDGKYYLNPKDADHHIENKSIICDLSIRGITHYYTFLIKDPVKDLPLGFIALEFDTESGMDVSDSTIWKYQNKIANLLNQTYTDK